MCQADKFIGQMDRERADDYERLCNVYESIINDLCGVIEDMDEEMKSGAYSDIREKTEMLYIDICKHVDITPKPDGIGIKEDREAWKRTAQPRGQALGAVNLPEVS